MDDFLDRIIGDEEMHRLADEVERLERAPRNLLARIHGDGGQHDQKVGREQSCIDAEAKVCELRMEIERLRACADGRHLDIIASAAEVDAENIRLRADKGCAEREALLCPRHEEAWLDKRFEGCGWCEVERMATTLVSTDEET